MAERTDLVIAVDNSQIKSAAEALKALGFEATIAESASTKLAKATVEAGRTTASAAKAGSSAMKELSTSATRAAGDVERLANAASKTDLGGSKVGRGFDEATLEIGRTRNALIDLTNATTSLGASASVDKLTSSLKDSNIAALEAARSMIRLREAEAEVARKAGPLATADTAPGVGPVRQVPASDAAQISAFTSAMSRAEQSAERLGQTLNRSISTGADAAKQSITDLSRATTSLGATGFADLDKVTTSLGAAAAKAQEASNEVQRLRVNLSELSTAGTSFGAATGPTVQPTDLRSKLLATDVQKSADSQALLDRLTQGATKAIDQQAPALQKATHAHDGHWKSVRRTAFEQQQLSYQLHDFTVQVLGGQSPLLALVQQGSQLAGTFGGIRGAITAVLALITPTVAIIGSAVLAVGAFALALARVESSARTLNTLQAQLEATGRAGEFTDAQLKKMIDTLALMPGVSRNAAVGIVSEFSKAHEISGDLAQRLQSLVADFAKSTGVDIPTAAAQLARAFSDPAKGAKTLEEALGTLRSSEVLAIQELTNVGDRIKAQEILFQALERSVRGVAERAMTPLQHATNELGNSWDRLMRSFEQSEGLKNVNILLSKIVDSISWLINNADKLQNVGVNPALLMVPGGLPAAIGGGLGTNIGNGVRSLLGFESTPTQPTVPTIAPTTAASTIARPSTAPAGKSAVVSDRDDEIKKALELGASYRSLGGQMTDLTKKRDALSAAAKLAAGQYGVESTQAKRLRDSVSAINEQLARLGKRAQAANAQGERIEDILLKDRVNAIKDALTLERESLTTQDRLLQSAYQLGENSLKATFDKRIAILRQGTENQVKALDDQIKLLQDRLKDPKIDPERKTKFTEQIKDLNREKTTVQARGQNEEILANDQLRQSYLQLKEQVEGYRIELLRMQGDEAGAAKLQAEQAIRRAKILSGQASGTGLPNVDTGALERALQQQNAINRAKEVTSFLNERLSIQQSTIERLAKDGSISEIGALEKLGQARQQTVAQLEQVVQGMEAIAKLTQNKDNWRLQLDTAKAREELEALRQAMNPVKDKFDSIFKGATQDFFNDVLGGALSKTRRSQSQRPGDSLDGSIQSLESSLASATDNGDRARLRDEIGRVRARRDQLNNSKTGDGTSPIVELFKNLFNNIGKQINSIVSKELTSQLFGKDGPFGSLGKKVGEIFGDPRKTDPTITLRTSLDQLSSPMSRLQTAADAAADALGRVSGSGTIKGTGTDNQVSISDVGNPVAPSQPADVLQATADAAGKLTDSAKATADASTDTTNSLIKLTSAAIKGSDSLGLLSTIIQMLQSVGIGGKGGPGGLIGNVLGSVLGGSSTAAATSAVLTDSEMLSTLGMLGLSGGGYTGDADTKKVTGVVHGKEFVFSAPAVKTLGLDVLNDMHAKASKGSAHAILTTALTRTSVAGNREIGGQVSAGKMYRVNERDPEVLKVGGRQYLMTGNKTGEVQPMSSAKGGDTHIHVSVAMPQGGSRDTATQWGAAAGRHIRNSLRRNG